MKFRKTLLILSIVMGFIFFFSGAPKASAYFVSVLSRVPGYKITKDYGIALTKLPVQLVYFGKNYVKYVGLFHYNRIINLFKKELPGNACIDFKLSYQIVSCEAVTIVPKK